MVTVTKKLAHIQCHQVSVSLINSSIHTFKQLGIPNECPFQIHNEENPKKPKFLYDQNLMHIPLAWDQLLHLNLPKKHNHSKMISKSLKKIKNSKTQYKKTIKTNISKY